MTWCWSHRTLICVILFFRRLQKTVCLKLNPEWFLFTVHIDYKRWLEVSRKTTLVPNNKLWYVPLLASGISDLRYYYCCLPMYCPDFSVFVWSLMSRWMLIFGTTGKQEWIWFPDSEARPRCHFFNLQSSWLIRNMLQVVYDKGRREEVLERVYRSISFQMICPLCDNAVKFKLGAIMPMCVQYN